MPSTLHLVPATQQEEWDQFINMHPQGHLLQSWGWGELKAGFGWSPLRLALRDEQEHIVAAAQVLRRTAPHVPLRLGHLAYIPKGPVIDWSQPALCKEFLLSCICYLGNKALSRCVSSPIVQWISGPVKAATQYNGM